LTCATIYQRDFNGARNIFLNVRDAVARVNGKPTWRPADEASMRFAVYTLMYCIPG
jgi:transposase